MYCRATTAPCQEKVLTSGLIMILHVLSRTVLSLQEAHTRGDRRLKKNQVIIVIVFQCFRSKFIKSGAVVRTSKLPGSSSQASMKDFQVFFKTPPTHQNKLPDFRNIRFFHYLISVRYFCLPRSGYGVQIRIRIHRFN
jgi:hypothetical protein